MEEATAARFPLGAEVHIEDLARDPYPILARLRREEPVSWVGELGMWVLTRYGDITAMLRDPETFTTDSPQSTIRDTFGPQVLSTDGPDHRRFKRATQSPFAPAVVEEEWGDGVRRICSDLLDSREATVGAAESFEVMSGLAAPLSLRTMGLLLGIPDDHLPELRATYDRFAEALQNFSGDPAVRERGRAEAERLRARLASLFEAARESGEDRTLTGRLAHHDGRDLSRSEAISNLLIVLFGGIETTESMIGNAIWSLLQHPEVLSEAELEISHGRQGRLNAAIEESLRWEPAVQSCTRHVTRDTRFAGIDFGKGDVVQCMIGGANRDPEIFPDPDRFDAGRFAPGNETPRHLAFGLSRHFCLGARLARLETQVSITALLQRLPALRGDDPRNQPPTGHEFRKPKALWVTKGSTRDCEIR